MREKIGPIAVPDIIQEAPGLPKTRSGKVSIQNTFWSGLLFINSLFMWSWSEDTWRYSSMSEVAKRFRRAGSLAGFVESSVVEAREYWPLEFSNSFAKYSGDPSYPAQDCWGLWLWSGRHDHSGGWECHCAADQWKVPQGLGPRPIGPRLPGLGTTGCSGLLISMLSLVCPPPFTNLSVLHFFSYSSSVSSLYLL